MSEKWEFYLGTIDGKIGSVFVDTEFAQVPDPALPYLRFVQIKMRNPTPNGLSNSEESTELYQVEDAIVAHMQPFAYVGRVTTAGRRDLFFYAPSPDYPNLDAINWRFPLYAPIGTGGCEDANWESYFDFLLPDAEQRQSIENCKVCHRLKELGDTLQKPREIDHWIFFADRTMRDRFEIEAKKAGYLIRSQTPEAEGERPFGIQVYRVDTPSFNEIDDITLPLFRLANEFGGEYDGWESVVVDE